MRSITKEIIGLVLATTLAFLILTHAAGFARAVSATGGAFTQSVAALQGRSKV